MPGIAERPDRTDSKDVVFVGTVVHENPERKRYEETIHDWVAGRAEYKDVVARDPQRHTRSVLGFLLYLLSGQTSNKHR